ncbi:MAG: 4Fe-4S binding protein [Deferribacteraceae bacterium]|jgi:ferredoxin-type protein NapH|nr:4Fe-4S binding protein [Deferribacteraceae bacterium]
MRFSLIRKIVQSSVLAGIFIVPILNMLEIYFIRGSFISFDIGSAAIADPVMMFQTVLTRGEFAASLFAAIVIPALMAIFFGRVWCSFFCPYTTIMEILERIPFIKKAIWRKKPVKNSRYKRAVIFLSLLFMVGIAGLPLLNLISPPSALSVQAILIIKKTPTVEILFIVLAIGLEFYSLRFICRYICPTGTCLSFFVNSRSLSPIYMGECLKCGKCAKVCPMGVEPTAELPSSFCHNCGQCIDACSDKRKPLRWKR